MQKTDLKEMTLREMEDFFTGIGEKKFRAKQVFSWMYGVCAGTDGAWKASVYDFQDMTDLPISLRQRLSELACIGKLAQKQVVISEKDATRKYLFALSDDLLIESVYMKYRYGSSVCLSSQAGCRMGCSFCASAVNGFERNLTAGEMIEQVLAIQNDIGQRISNIVVMGTGEPFDNYENLCRFLNLVHAKEGMNIGLRHITVSTCGLLSGISAFARDFPQVGLAVSLHASNDAVRAALMPIHRGGSMAELLSACRAHIEKTGRRITFEYALIGGKNDTPAHARELAAALKGMLCHVNLIPLNEVRESGLFASPKEACERFKEVLEKVNISVTVRRAMGSDIHGACGQLRANGSAFFGA